MLNHHARQINWAAAQVPAWANRMILFLPGYQKTFRVMIALLSPQASSKPLLQAITASPSSIRLQNSISLGCVWSKTTRLLSRRLTRTNKAPNTPTMEETAPAWSSMLGTRCMYACLLNVMCWHLTRSPPSAAFWLLKSKGPTDSDSLWSVFFPACFCSDESSPWVKSL